MINNAWDYWEAGYKIFGLYGGVGTRCECGQKDCKNAFKHPRTNGWQNIIHWDQDQMEMLYKIGHFNTGFGVLVEGIVVVDIDPRNGGTMESLPVDILSAGGYVVETGGGGWHVYFKAPPGVALLQHHEAMPGIDFKSSGFVVGAGSLHASGQTYEHISGDLEALPPLPDQIVAMIRKPDTFRAFDDSGAAHDVSEQEIADMLAHISPDCPYDQWVAVGFAVHHTTSGAGFDLWDTWSSKGQDYPGTSALQYKWGSFGKGGMTPVTIGTLVHMAEADGYEQPVTFDVGAPPTPIPDTSGPFEYDLTKPPGFVGKVADWITSQGYKKRERLSVAAALNAVGNAMKSRAIIEYDGITDTPTNTMFLCLAESGSGKDAVKKAVSRLNATTGLASYGGIKSEQEMYRAFIHSDTVCYNLDEISHFFQKLEGAKKSGTSYLQGIPSVILKAFTGDMSMNFDEMEKQAASLRTRIAAINKMQDNNEANDHDLEEMERCKATLERISTGGELVENPFLSLMGYATPDAMRDCFTKGMVKDGLLGRMFIVEEPDNTPRRNRDRVKDDSIPFWLEAGLQALSLGAPIETTPEAQDALRALETIYHDMSVELDKQGLAPLGARLEQEVHKLSKALAGHSGIRTLQEVQWAQAFVDENARYKVRMAQTLIAEEDGERDKELLNRIVGFVERRGKVPHGKLLHLVKSRKFKEKTVAEGIKHAVKSGNLVETQGERGGTFYTL